MTQLTETLWAIPVPEDAKDFEIKYETSMSPTLLYCLSDSANGAGSQYLPENGNGYEILGCVTKDYSEVEFAKEVPNASFRSLLSAKEILFENPVEKPDELKMRTWDYKSKEEIEKANLRWQQAEKSLVKKVLIIKRK